MQWCGAAGGKRWRLAPRETMVQVFPGTVQTRGDGWFKLTSLRGAGRQCVQVQVQWQSARQRAKTACLQPMESSLSAMVGRPHGRRRSRRLRRVEAVQQRSGTGNAWHRRACGNVVFLFQMSFLAVGKAPQTLLKLRPPPLPHGHIDRLTTPHL